jgi:hypothetical protein
MDDATKPQTTVEPTPARRTLDDWRGDIEQRPPIWRRRPRTARVRDLWKATKPLLSQFGEGKSWT